MKSVRKGDRMKSTETRKKRNRVGNGREKEKGYLMCDTWQGVMTEARVLLYMRA
jgi:hypothetical protein